MSTLHNARFSLPLLAPLLAFCWACGDSSAGDGTEPAPPAISADDFVGSAPARGATQNNTEAGRSRRTGAREANRVRKR